MKRLAASSPCPCGRFAGKDGTALAQVKSTQQGPQGKLLSYGDCCGRWLEDATQTAQPPDAQSLMRSRYSAFVLEREAWLLQSWATSHRPPSIAFDPATRWLGLDLRSHRQTGDASAEVEFVARQKPASGPALRLHERSRFVWEAGRWLYVDGDAL